MTKNKNLSILKERKETMKKKLTKQEYEQAKLRLKEIDEEKKVLEESVPSLGYQSHIKLGKNFDELIINIMRSNNYIDEEINHIVNDFIQNTKTSKKIQKKLLQEIKADIETLRKVPLAARNQEDSPEVIAVSQHYPGYDTLHHKLTDLIDQRKANDFLYQKVDQLDQETIHLEQLTIAYEKRYKKQNRKKVKQKQKSYSQKKE